MKKFTRRFLAALFAAMLILTTLMSLDMSSVFAATSGSCGTNATWSYNATTHTLTISGTGATKDYRDTTNKLLRTEQAPWIDYKADITTVVVNEGITEIGDYAFFECTSLTSVSLPSTLQKLDGWGGAVGNVDKTYGCFQSCTALQNITLPANLVEIEPYVFNGCTALKKIELPNSVTTIGKYAFFDCSALERATFGNGLTSLGENCFRNSGLKKVNWNEALTAIPNYAFFNCGFVEIELPESIASVGTQAFKNCTFLRDITVNNRNTSFSGNVCEGSNQSVTVHGHSGSTAQTFAEQYSYAFVSLDSCQHANTHHEITKEANCTETGIDATICDDCGETILETTIPALGHEWGDPVETVDESTINGHVYNSYVCSVCGETKEEVVHQLTANLSDIDLENINIDASILNETVYVWMPGYYNTTVVRAASCTATGLERYHCEVDGCDQTETHIVPKHHTVTNWTVTTPATCTEDGERRGTCVECGETVTETVEATGHSYDKDNPSEVWDDDEDGHTHKIYICDNRGAEIEEYVHNEWIDGLYTARSTTYDNCELPGVELDVCDVCNAVRTVQIPARGEHDLYETNRTEPDCTARGRIYLACHNCSYTTTEYIPALGHDFVKDASSSVEPTCTESGSIFYRCSRCSASKTETVDALGHDPQEGTYVVDTAPTCTKTGTGHGYCLRCEQNYTETIAALGHDYQAVETDLTSEGKPGHVLSTPTCTRCNARETGEVVHKEWTEGNYNVTASTSATCTLGANEIRQCTICNTIGTVETEPALGHFWQYQGSFSSDAISGMAGSIGSATSGINLPSWASNIDLSGLNTEEAYQALIDRLPVETEPVRDEDNNIIGYSYVGKVTADGVVFLCPHCLSYKSVPVDTLKNTYWSFDLLNTEPQRSGAPIMTTDENGEEVESDEERNTSSYLDINADGIINGRDYGYLKTLAAAEAQAIAEAEAAQQGEEGNN